MRRYAPKVGLGPLKLLEQYWPFRNFCIAWVGRGHFAPSMPFVVGISSVTQNAYRFDFASRP